MIDAYYASEDTIIAGQQWFKDRQALANKIYNDKMIKEEKYKNKLFNATNLSDLN